MGAVVDARGHDEDAEHVLLGRDEAELGAGAVDLGADVHGGAGLVRRDELGVERDGRIHGLKEQLVGHGRARDELGRPPHAHRVSIRPEHRDGPVGPSERLQPFIGLLPVVQRRRHPVDADVWILYELERRPFARLDRVVRFYVAIDYNYHPL